MKEHGILIDGEGVLDGGGQKSCCKYFEICRWADFFEFIQRKGDDGFGEGNFKALLKALKQKKWLKASMAIMSLLNESV